MPFASSVTMLIVAAVGLGASLAFGAIGALAAAGRPLDRPGRLGVTTAIGLALLLLG